MYLRSLYCWIGVERRSFSSRQTTKACLWISTSSLRFDLLSEADPAPAALGGSGSVSGGRWKSIALATTLAPPVSSVLPMSEYGAVFSCRRWRTVTRLVQPRLLAASILEWSSQYIHTAIRPSESAAAKCVSAITTAALQSWPSTFHSSSFAVSLLALT